MKRERDLHKQVRVVYRACRKLYGKEKTQDECLKVFKVIFPELYKARTSDCTNFILSEESRKRLVTICQEWKPTDELKKLCDYILIEIGKLRSKDDFMTFCVDIMPVAMRIRKLTPTETGRLMGLRDEEIQMMYDAGLSNSSMYKLHGNSIVVDVMTALFDKLIVNTDEERKAGMQLTLF